MYVCTYICTYVRMYIFCLYKCVFTCTVYAYIRTQLYYMRVSTLPETQTPVKQPLKPAVSVTGVEETDSGPTPGTKVERKVCNTIYNIILYYMYIHMYICMCTCTCVRMYNQSMNLPHAQWH